MKNRKRLKISFTCRFAPLLLRFFSKTQGTVLCLVRKLLAKYILKDTKPSPCLCALPREFLVFELRVL